jgi:hypothetical protein
LLGHVKRAEGARLVATASSLVKVVSGIVEQSLATTQRLGRNEDLIRCGLLLAPSRIYLPRDSASETIEKHRTIFQKLFLNTHVDKVHELSDLSREELLELINEDGAFRNTDATTRMTGPSSDPVKNASTIGEFHPLLEAGRNACRQEDIMSNELTDIRNVAFPPLEHARCRESSTVSNPRSSPLNPSSIATFDASIPACPTDEQMASRKDQAIKRIVKICDYFLARPDNYFDMSFDKEPI